MKEEIINEDSRKIYQETCEAVANQTKQIDEDYLLQQM